MRLIRTRSHVTDPDPGATDVSSPVPESAGSSPPALRVTLITMQAEEHTRRPATRRRLTLAAPGLSILLGLSILSGMTTGSPVLGPQAGVNREAMWPAPTTEDWASPCLITWQRTWEDALAISLETERAILVCVNMDGEIASEHYAGIRYRQPDIAALYAPYVAVIASVYRHNPRDFDEEGRRIPCPRFGTVTCGEHIAIEPQLFGEFFEGTRVAPRHIMVELDRAETYDVYYALDTASVFETIKQGIVEREHVPPVIARDDKTLIERVESRDVGDREHVESAYLTGDRTLRRQLIKRAIESPGAAQTGLLRLALFDLDLELNKLARLALLETRDEGAIDLLVEALRVPLDAKERDALIAALAALGESSSRARALAVVHTGLTRESSAVDVSSWAGAEYPAPPTDRGLLVTALESGAARSDVIPNDPTARLELAEASLALAVAPESAQRLASDPRTASDYQRLMFEDARNEALGAEELGASGWRVDSVVAIASYYLDEREEAYRRAELAVGAIAPGQTTERGWNAMAVLSLFAMARQDAITKAVRAKEDWPPEWLTDVNAAYSVLAEHPLASDTHVAAHYDFLWSLGARGPASRSLDAGVRRFPGSSVLHDRLRGRILFERGTGGLEASYDSMLKELDAAPILEWFAGYASLVAAEFHRRRGRDERALASYERGIGLFERYLEGDTEARASTDHYVALALAGRARIAYERGEDALATEELLASFARRPEAAASLDGLNISPVDTAKMLRARLTDKAEGNGESELLAKLQAALDALDPDLLLLPAYERAVPGRPNRTDGRRRRRPRGR